MEVASRQHDRCIICHTILFSVEAACSLSRVLHILRQYQAGTAMRQQKQRQPCLNTRKQGYAASKSGTAMCVQATGVALSDKNILWALKHQQGHEPIFFKCMRRLHARTGWPNRGLT